MTPDTFPWGSIGKFWMCPWKSCWIETCWKLQCGQTSLWRSRSLGGLGPCQLLCSSSLNVVVRELCVCWCVWRTLIMKWEQRPGSSLLCNRCPHLSSSSSSSFFFFSSSLFSSLNCLLFSFSLAFLLCCRQGPKWVLTGWQATGEAQRTLFCSLQLIHCGRPTMH